MFKKGDRVKYIASWNRSGDVTWYVHDAVVLACGEKQMTLADAHTGRSIGRSYHPREEQWNNRVVKACSMAEAVEIAKAKAIAERAELIEHYRERLANEGKPAYYRDTMRDELAKLEAGAAGVVTPYEVGHQYGPKEGAAIEHKPRTPPTKYSVWLNGDCVGTRKSHRTYTHAVVCQRANGAFYVHSYAGSLALARKVRPFGNAVQAIVEVKTDVVTPEEVLR